MIPASLPFGIKKIKQNPTKKPNAGTTGESILRLKPGINTNLVSSRINDIVAHLVADVVQHQPRED